MNPMVAQSQSEPVPPSRDGLPAFRPLAGVAFAANVPALAWLLMVGRLGNGLSVLAGLTIGLALDGAKGLFIALLPLKYLVLGGLMFLLVRGGHLSIAWFTVGFLITQVSITVATVSHLARLRQQ